MLSSVLLFVPTWFLIKFKCFEKLFNLFTKYAGKLVLVSHKYNIKRVQNDNQK